MVTVAFVPALAPGRVVASATLRLALKRVAEAAARPRPQGRGGVVERPGSVAGPKQPIRRPKPVQIHRVDRASSSANTRVTDLPRAPRRPHASLLERRGDPFCGRPVDPAAAERDVFLGRDVSEVLDDAWCRWPLGLTTWSLFVSRGRGGTGRPEVRTTSWRAGSAAEPNSNTAGASSAPLLLQPARPDGLVSARSER